MAKSSLPKPEPFSNADEPKLAPITPPDPPDTNPPAPAAAGAAPDPFDPASLRLGDNLNASFGVKKVLLSLAVRKPDKSWWIRAHPSEDYRLQTGVIELKADRSTELYLVSQALWAELVVEVTFRPKLLVTAINRQGTPFLWEVNLPRPDGRPDEWSRTALEAVRFATTGWVRVTAGSNSYEVYQTTATLPEPEWPDVAFRDLLRIAFKERFINDLNHPILRKLRGEV